MNKIPWISQNGEELVCGRCCKKGDAYNWIHFLCEHVDCQERCVDNEDTGKDQTESCAYQKTS